LSSLNIVFFLKLFKESLTNKNNKKKQT